ncbi:hypothetical protein C6P40_004593 [Pichia californica]|uniref:Uncharacterized protein n=1 Tax=Pichia californica TaxID=460514 RepID=A0A9P6WGA3_9ASCO|nr:hypothetical protein C6P40_004593 [[Candida] californica]
MISTFPAIQDFKDQIQDIGIGIEKIRVTPQNLANKDNLISVQNHARLSFDLPKIFLKDNIIKYLKACFISSAIHHPFTVIDDHIEENQNLVLLEINFPPYLNKDFFKSVSQHLLKPYGEIIHQQDAPIDTNSAFNCKSFDLHKPKTSFFIFKATMNSLPPSTNFVPRAPDVLNSPDCKVEVHIRSNIKFCTYCRSLTHTFKTCPIKSSCFKCHSHDHDYLSCGLVDSSIKEETFNSLPENVQKTFFNRCRSRPNLPYFLTQKISSYFRSSVKASDLKQSLHKVITSRRGTRQRDSNSNPTSPVRVDKQAGTTISPSIISSPKKKIKPTTSEDQTLKPSDIIPLISFQQASPDLSKRLQEDDSSEFDTPTQLHDSIPVNSTLSTITSSTLTSSSSFDNQDITDTTQLKSVKPNSKLSSIHSSEATDPSSSPTQPDSNHSDPSQSLSSFSSNDKNHEDTQEDPGTDSNMSMEL